MIKNLKVYFRFLMRNKAYTTISIVGFSVALSLVILLGSYVIQEMSVDRFHEKGDRIFLLRHELGSLFPNPIAEQLKEKYPEIEDYVRAVNWDVPITDDNNKKQLHKVLYADKNFFEVFSFPLFEGLASEVLKDPNSVVLSQEYATKLFGELNPIGKRLRIADADYQITGIMKDFSYNTAFSKCDLVLPYRNLALLIGGNNFDRMGNASFPIFLLMKEGQNLSTKIPLIIEDFKERFFMYQDVFVKDLYLVNLKDLHYQTSMLIALLDLDFSNKQQAWLYLSVAILILLVALLNYINMTVAQGASRAKEAAIKKLMGGTYKQLFIQFLFESFLLTAISFGFACLLAFVLETLFNNMLSTQLFLMEQFTVRFVFIWILIFFLVAFISGLIPALVMSKFKPIEVIKGGFRRKLKASYSKVLVVFQNTLSIALIASVFIIIAQSYYLRDLDLGFKTERVYTIAFDNKEALDHNQRELLKNRFQSMTGIEKISFSDGLMFGDVRHGGGGNNIVFEKEGKSYSFQYLRIDKPFLDIYGIETTPTLFFSDPNRVVFNRKAANEMGLNLENPEMEVAHWGKQNVGAVIEHLQMRNLDWQETSIMLIPIKESESVRNISILLSQTADPVATVRAVHTTLSDVIGGEIFTGSFADEAVQSWYEKEDKMVKIISSFTVCAIALMMMGLFAISMYLIRQKQKEVAIRKVSGATEKQMLLLLNTQSISCFLVAFVIATPIAYYLMSNWLNSFIYRTTLHWWYFPLAGIIVLLISLLTVSMQTWRAARANPIKYLKSE